MNTLRPYRLNHIASFAIVMLVSACGGGGTAPSTPQAAGVTASQAPAPAGIPTPSSSSIDSPPNASSVAVAADASFPQPATHAAWDEATSAYTPLPAPAPTDAGGEAPYPDLRMLPMQTMPFEPVVFGDVSGSAVTPAG